MAEGYHALTEKEKQTLRLIVRGHDAKSTARELGLSVHTINERLRDARRKLSVSSSREAARLLLDAEGDGPNFLADKDLRDAASVTPGHYPGSDHEGTRTPWLRVAIGGALAMAMIGALLASGFRHDGVERSTAVAIVGSDGTPSRRVPSPESSEAVRSARIWLALVDQARWGDSWNATGQAFRRHNTRQAWASASERARTPLGAMISRRESSHEWVPAPPRGYQIVKFQTRFAEKPDATERLALAREGGAWKVVGYTIH